MPCEKPEFNTGQFLHKELGVMNTGKIIVALTLSTTMATK